MKQTVYEIIANCNAFNPTTVSLQDSSDVQSNINAATNSYHLVESPLNEITNIISEV